MILESITFTSVEVKKNRNFLNLWLFLFLFYGTENISIQHLVFVFGINDTDTFRFLVKITCNFILFYFSIRGLKCPQIVCTHHFSAGNSKTK